MVDEVFKDVHHVGWDVVEGYSIVAAAGRALGINIRGTELNIVIAAGWPLGINTRGSVTESLQQDRQYLAVTSFQF